jgi:hypothetical protein
MRTLVNVFRAAVIVVVLAAAAHGREMAGKIGITPQIGLVKSIGEFSERQDLGFAYELAVEYYVSSKASVGLQLFHVDFNTTGDPYPSSPTANTWPIDGLGVQAKYTVAATPFTDIFARVGFVLNDMEFPIHGWDVIGDLVSRSSRVSKTSAGFETGIGLSQYISKYFSFYGEIEYSLLFTKGVSITKEPATTWIAYDCPYNAQMAAIKMGLTFYLGGAK